MKKNILKFIAAFLALMLLLTISVSASSSSGNPTDSFSYWLGHNEKTLVFVNKMFDVETIITGNDLGYNDFTNKPNDIYCADDGKIYITENDVSRLTIIDSDYKKINTITQFVDQDGNSYEFSGASGVFVSEEGEIYICDTMNARILIGDINGKLETIIEQPTSTLIPDDFIFMPTALAIDSKNYMYVVSNGSTYGALLYDPNREFMGFYGANKVESTFSSVISNLWNNFFATDEQLAGKVQKIPYQFTDISIDKDDFVYTVTGAVDVSNKDQKGQIRCLNPKSKNILTVKSGNKYSNSDSFNFGNVNVASNISGTGYRLENFVSIDIDEDGFIYALESTYGRIFVYDSECNLLCAFGGGTGVGEQIGTFSNASSISVSDNKIFITDSTNNSITVFKLNEFGALLKKADALYLSGNYTEAKSLWEEINRIDPNCQLSYWGMAKACLLEKDYENALYYAKEGLDYSSYNQAFSYLRKDILKANFPIFILVIVFAAVFAIVFIVLKQKIGLRIKINQKVSVMLSSFIHPFRLGDAVKNYGQGSIVLATILLILFYVFKVLENTASGFLYSNIDKRTYNSLYTLIGSVGIILLFAACYWAMAVLFSGKCKLKEVYIISSYAMIPQIINSLFFVVLSNILISEESSILSGISVLMFILSGMVLCIGCMVVSDYSFFKFVGVSISAIIAMIVVIFVIFMVFKLDQELINFVSGLIREVRYR